MTSTPRPSAAPRSASGFVRAVVLAVAAGAFSATALAACGGPGGPAGSTGTTTPPPSTARSSSSSLLAFARCMRGHGVASFPDPAHGGFPKSVLAQLSAGDPDYGAASAACSHLLGHGGNGPDQAQLQQEIAQGLRFARCMRRHGVAFPDPASTGRIPDPASVGIDQGSPGFESANRACGRYRPPYMPSNAAYNAYARTHGS